MKWIAYIAAALVGSQSQAQGPAYEVVTFEERPDGIADFPIPDTEPIAGLPIGDCMVNPVGDYGGVLWQAGNPATYRNGPPYDGVGGWWVWQTETVAGAGAHWAGIVGGRDRAGRRGTHHRRHSPDAACQDLHSSRAW